MTTVIQPLRATSVSVSQSYQDNAEPILTKKSRGLSRWSIFNVHYPEFRTSPGAHLFKDCLINEDEEDIKRREKENIRPFDKSVDQYCIIAVGTTGVGKSSVVKLFCGDIVEISSTTISCTKDSTIYSEIDNEYKIDNRQWMDTQGTDDSDMDASDEKILKKVFKKLYEQKIRDIIIIWLVSGDMDRQKGEYLKQASFISGFETKLSTSNIWNSTLILQKMGQLQPKVNQIRGVIDAAKSNGGKRVFSNHDIINKHAIGFKCIDMINLKEDDLYQTLIENNTASHKMQKLGYVNVAEMKKFIHQKLVNIDCFRLDFENKICNKCSIRGDPRYLYYKCHYNPIPRHMKSIIAYHPAPLEFYHSLGTHMVHRGAVVHLHPGQLLSYHPSARRRIEVDDKESPIQHHPGDYLTVKSGLLCCANYVTKWSCCGADGEEDVGCAVRYFKKPVFERGCCQLREEYVQSEDTDGERKTDSTGMELSENGCQKKYECCGLGIDSKPCKSQWDCCEKQPFEEGCRSTYLCCEYDDGEQGCKQRFLCCLMPDEARGCEDKYECCDKPPDSKGCETVCDRCGVIWGYTPGCSWPQFDDDDAEDDYAANMVRADSLQSVNEVGNDGSGEHIVSDTVIIHGQLINEEEKNNNTLHVLGGDLGVIESDNEMEEIINK